MAICEVSFDSTGRESMKIAKILKRIGKATGDSGARLITTLFYFTVFVPLAVGVRLFLDPLRLKLHPQATFWLGRESRQPNLEEAQAEY